jgi:hypothetical protein
MNQFAAGSTLFRPDDAILALQSARDAGGIFRVADLSGGRPYGQNDLAVHGLEQLAGHHGNEIGRYRDLIGGEHAENLYTSELRLANVTNTEYLLIPGRVQHPSLEEAFVGSQVIVYRNRDALPRAYVAGGVEVLPGAAAIERLLAEDFDPRETVILAEPLPAGLTVEAGATGRVEWLTREVDRYTLRVTADRPGLLVLLDNWYPAWDARVNGEAAPVLRANHAFRAVPVAAGEQLVSLEYSPAALRTGALISVLVLALLLAVVVAAAVAGRRRSVAS